MTMPAYEDPFKSAMLEYQETIEKSEEAKYILGTTVFNEFIRKVEDDILSLFKNMPDRTPEEREQILNLKKDYNSLNKIVRYFTMYLNMGSVGKKKMLNLLSKEGV